MTWLALTLAVERAGGQMEMIGARHSSRLRGAIMGKNKSDVIDSEVLTHAGEIFDPPRWSWRRRDSWRCGGPWSAGPVPSLTATATGGGCCPWHGGPFPMCGPRSPDPKSTALAVLGRWPHLRSLASARAATLTAVVAEHTRDVADTPARAAAIKTAARGWAEFWDGHLDLDALAVDVTEHLTDLQRVPGPGGALHLPFTPVVGASLRR